MDNIITGSILYLQQHAAMLSSKTVTAGFDGFIDTIIRTIKNKPAGTAPVYFDTILDFGAYITEKSGGSFSVEFEEVVTKIGGNMPITANALARSGITVNCIGAFGYPQIAPVFNNLSGCCNLYSFTDAGTAVAYEFTDGKMILAQMKALNEAGWEVLKERIGLPTLIRLFETSDIFCLFNWSEIDASTAIWKGVLQEVLPACKQDKQPAFFVDISDCSKRSHAAIQELLTLLRTFAGHTKLTLSLNSNEYRRICAVLPGNDPEQTFENGHVLYKQLGIDTLLLHNSKKAVAFSGNAMYTADSYFVSNPFISTGAGDNFNAGYIAASLTGAAMPVCLSCANAAAAWYIRSGTSAGISDIIHFLQEQ